MASEATERPYRPCVGVALFDSAGRVFLGRRGDGPRDAWQMPQGGIDKGEAPIDAAFRELEEETGIPADKASLIREHSDWLAYDLPSDLAGKAWKGKFRGQTQRWFALRFLGADADVNIETKHPEFDAWRWAPLAEAPDLIVPFKRAVYEQVAVAFADIGPS